MYTVTQSLTGTCSYNLTDINEQILRSKPQVAFLIYLNEAA